MCGIAGFFQLTDHQEEYERIIREMLAPIKHRGDEEHAYECKQFDFGALGCNRLAIVDREHGRQPLTNQEETLFAVMNGEIYNYRELCQELQELGYRFHTSTDTEVLVHGYQAWGQQLVERIDGVFAFIIFDQRNATFFAARDHMGVKPLYYLNRDGAYFIASEMKSLTGFGQNINVLMPGQILTPQGTQAYSWLKKQPLEDDEQTILATFKETLVAAVRKQVQTDLPIGVLFSGGLDSTAILHLATRYHQNVTAISVGFEDSADVEMAQRFCRERGIKHHTVHLTIENLLHDLDQTVYYTETFETINIIDSCLLAPAFKLAHELGIKIVLCGDGSDELLAGYDFFRTYPDPHYLMTYRLENAYRTDMQRLDRCSMRYSVETRVPFLDKAFMNIAYNVPMSMKLRGNTEKWILREVLKNELPDYIAQRPKVRLPDGAGLKFQLMDFARQQQTEIDPAILDHLKLDHQEGAYFLAQYLKLGYPLPEERYKRPALDFNATDGYFDFIT